MKTKTDAIFFPNLDALRFFSFLIVFMTHCFAIDDENIRQQTWYKLIKMRLFGGGDIGVGFFFVLSGFLITYLLLKEKETTGGINVRKFYFRRSLRIWPLYYFCVAFGFLIFPILKSYFHQIPNETANPFLSSLFLNNFNAIINGPPDASILAVLWSVAIEEQFYLIWPIFFYFIKPKNYIFIFIFIIAASLVFRLLNSGNGMTDIHTLGVIGDMSMGGLGAYMILNSKHFYNKIENLNRSIIIVGYVVFFLIVYFKNNIFSIGLAYDIKRILFSAFFLFIILEQNFSLNSIFKVGSLQKISRLGKYTYGLYCLHPIALLIVVTLLKRFNLYHLTWHMWLLEVPLGLLLSIIVSKISYKYYESRFLKLKDKFAVIKTLEFTEN